MTDAFNTEAAQLQDAELDLRINARFDRVFGNGLFEDAADTGANSLAPGHVKMNSFFEDPTRQQDQRFPRKHDSENTPDKAQQGMLFRKTASTG